MKLNEIYYGEKLSQDNVNINGISENSKNIRKNYIFFSRKNKKLQEEYIKEAIKNDSLNLGDSLEVEMKMSSKNSNIYHVITDTLKIK